MVKCIFTLLLDPFFLPKEQVDLGAIKFVMSGANIMCPGLTSPGAKIEPVPQNTIVVSFELHNFYFNFSYTSKYCCAD